jgi:glucose/arabinose dehydrogenase
VRLVGDGVVTVADGLNEPVALLLEDDTSVLVTEVASGSISRVDLTSGERTELATGLHDPRSIAQLPDGRVVVTEPGTGTVLAIDLDSGERSVLATGLRLAIDHHDLPDNTPLGIAVPSNGAIYLSGGDNSILKITLRPE